MTTPSSTPAARGRYARTHELLQRHALELFEERGYDQTTTAQIAAAAGVTEMTFFRHFASKDRVLLDDPYDPMIVAGIAGQPLGDPALLRASRGTRAAWEMLPEPASNETRRRVRIVARTPSLRAAMVDHSAESEAVVVAQLIRDGADPAVAAVAAAALMAAITAGLFVWATADARPLGEAILAALDVVECSRA
ncbi:MAG: TetR family transcriptional regulator [Pseudolysinimonas sp.]